MDKVTATAAITKSPQRQGLNSSSVSHSSVHVVADVFADPTLACLKLHRVQSRMSRLFDHTQTGKTWATAGASDEVTCTVTKLKFLDFDSDHGTFSMHGLSHVGRTYRMQR